MKLNSNYKKYPNNFYQPENITIGNRKYKIFLTRFSNLYEIYEFLKSDYEINHRVFTELSSITGSYDFAGIPYEEAVEDLINFDDDKYADFLTIVKELARVKRGYKHEYEMHRTLAGGHLNIPAYSSGSPLCYETYERVKKPKFITIYANLSYPWHTSKNQVLNRTIILVSIINALEKNGYNVNLNTFELSENIRELINIVVTVKRHGERTNLQTLYKTNCHVEFLRRILFRVLETMAVEEDWQTGYGKTCSPDFTRCALNVGKDDIVFGTPGNLGIKGNDLNEDFVACLKKLNLSDYFDIREISEEFKENAKRLIK